jgi:ribose/xylose/arabinose/galactoside ABC-type transport system permease subunit
MSHAPRQHSLGGLLGRSETGLVVAIIAVAALTALLDPIHTYWTDSWLSALLIIRPAVMLGIFALGSAIVIISGGIDLSSGSMIAFGGTVCATIMLVLDPKGIDNGDVAPGVIAVAIAGTIVVGFLVGSLHAWLITVIGLPPFIATLATLVGLRSFGRALVELITAEMASRKILPQSITQISVSDPKFRALATHLWIPVSIFAVLAFLCWLLMSRTVVGRHLYALGGNEQAARLSGIRTDRLKWLAYCISAILSAIAGIIYVGDQSVADPQTLGRGYELNSIAAAVVGGCSLQGGVGTITGTVLGCFFLRTVIDGVGRVVAGGKADVYEGMIVGVVVVVAVTFNQLRQRLARGKQFFPGLLGWTAILTLGLFAAALLPMLIGGGGGLVATAAFVALLVALKIFEGRRAKPPTTELVET